MHIGLISPNESDTFGDNIEYTLSRMGHTVTNLGATRPALGNSTINRAAEILRQAYPSWEAHVHTKMAAAAEDRGCNAVITTDGGLAPEAVARLRELGIPTALWFPDHVANLGRQRMLVAPYNAIFFKDQLMVRRFRDLLDLPVWHLPEACNPDWHRPVATTEKKEVIVVAGNTYMTRLLLLERLHKAGVPLVIYGNATPRWAPSLLPPSLHAGRSIFREEKARIFREAAGVLNNLYPAEMSGVNARLFEAAGSGAAVLCERRPELDDMFDPDREVAPFSTFDELLEQINDLLDRPERSFQIGDAASKRAHSEHTYKNRLSLLLEKIF